MIRCLIDCGANALGHTCHGDSVLHVVLATFGEYDALETAKLLVAQGCDPLQINSCGKTPLRIAVERRHVSVARYLLSLGAPLSPDQLFPSISRGMRNDTRMIRFLVENGFDILARTGSGDSLLHIAMYTLHEDEGLETAKFLVAHGCDPVEANSGGETPLHIALTRGYVSVVHYLLSLGIPLPSDIPATMNLRKETCARMIRCLVENGADVLALSRDGDTLLHTVLAAFDEHDALETAKLLVAHSCDPLQANSRGETPLCIAVKRRHVSVARYLLSLGAPPSSAHPIPSILRGTQDDARMIYFLIENGFDVFSQAHAGSGDSLLHIVLDTFHEDNVLATTKLLLAHGCDPLQPNVRGETPIRIAIERGHVFLMRYLLSLGIPLPWDALFVVFYSPRLCKDSRGRSEMVYFLVDQGANIFSTESNGDSVLHRVIITSPRATDDPEVLDVITFFIARGCDPAISNIHGVTPLHVAVKQGDPMLVKHLISLNAPLPPDILFTAIESDLMSSSEWHWMMHVIKVLVTSGCYALARNEAGYTPLRTAVIKGYVPVVDYLLTVTDSPPSDSEDLLSAATLAPLAVRSEMVSMLNDRLARGGSPDDFDLPPAKRTRHS